MLRQLTMSWCLLGVLHLSSCDQTSTPAGQLKRPSSQPSKPAVSTDAKNKPAPATNIPIANPANQQKPTPTNVPSASQGPANGPRFACSAATIDFGHVWAGAIVKRDFAFRNEGAAALILPEFRARCSCSTVPYWTKEVPPGGEGIISYTLNTTDKPNGELVEYITFDTNDPAQKNVKIHLKGTVQTAVSETVIYDALYERDIQAGKKPLPVDRSKLSFGKIQATDRLHRVLRLTNTSGRPLSLILSPPPMSSRFTIDIQETVAGQEFELTVIGEPPFPLGYSTQKFEFTTNVPEQPTYDLTAYAEVPPRIEIIPQKIVYDTKKYSNRERPIKIINHAGTRINVLSISTSEPRYGIRLLPPAPETPAETVVQVVLPDGGYEIPSYGELIDIQTDDVERPLIHIQVLPTIDMTLITPRPADKPLTMQPVPMGPVPMQPESMGQ